MYMGDDLPDWEVMKRVGVAACPNDAATEIKEIEQIMRVQQTWEIANW